MSGHHRFGLVSLIIALLLLSAAPGANATICDDDPAAIPYEPTVDPSLLNRVLGLLGEIPIVDFGLAVPFSQEFDHTLDLIMNGSIDLAGVDFVVIPGLGSIEVELNLPAWDSDMLVSVEHDPCRDCDAEWGVCTEPCDPTYEACMSPCVPTYEACVANNCDPNGDPGLYQSCVDSCAFFRDGCMNGCVLARDFCYGGCDLEKFGCDTHNIAYFFERDLLDNLLDGQTIGMSFDSGTITQVADVCVTGTCEAVHPYEGTAVSLQNFHVRYFPEDDPLGFGLWLNGMVTDLVSDMVSPADMIVDFLVDAETGQGVLINAFGNDIKKDGCSPVQEVSDCTGAACAIATKPDISARQSTSLLLYALPLVAMGGLILWGRRR